jgi:hypothetical protein
MHTNDLVRAMEVVHDHVLYERYDIFESRLERLHYIDPRKEHISLLVCQHLLGKKPGDCSEPWSHTHPDLQGYVSSMGIYLKHGEDEQTLVIDLGEGSMTTVSSEDFSFLQKMFVANEQQHELIALLKHATKSYRHNMSKQLEEHVPHRHSWERFHDAELKHYKWLYVPSMPTKTGVSQFACAFPSFWMTTTNVKMHSIKDQVTSI